MRSLGFCDMDAIGAEEGRSLVSEATYRSQEADGVSPGNLSWRKGRTGLKCGPGRRGSPSPAPLCGAFSRQEPKRGASRPPFAEAFFSRAKGALVVSRLDCAPRPATRRLYGRLDAAPCRGDDGDRVGRAHGGFRRRLAVALLCLAARRPGAQAGDRPKAQRLAASGLVIATVVSAVVAATLFVFRGQALDHVLHAKGRARDI